MERVLLIDDEPSIRLFYSDILIDRGYDVLEATSGDEALGLIQREPVDLAILDIKLHSESGLEVLQRIVRNNPEVPVILLTAYMSFQDDYTSWLAESYMLKSGDPSEFLKEVDRVVHQTKRFARSGHPSKQQKLGGHWNSV